MGSRGYAPGYYHTLSDYFVEFSVLDPPKRQRCGPRIFQRAHSFGLCRSRVCCGLPQRNVRGIFSHALLRHFYMRRLCAPEPGSAGDSDAARAGPKNSVVGVGGIGPCAADGVHEPSDLHGQPTLIMGVVFDAPGHLLRHCSAHYDRHRRS